MSEFGGPEGFGAVFRCRICDTRWEFFIWMLCGGETVRRIDSPGPPADAPT